MNSFQKQNFISAVPYSALGMLPVNSTALLPFHVETARQRNFCQTTPPLSTPTLCGWTNFFLASNSSCYLNNFTILANLISAVVFKTAVLFIMAQKRLQTTKC